MSVAQPPNRLDSALGQYGRFERVRASDARHDRAVAQCQKRRVEAAPFGRVRPLHYPTHVEGFAVVGIRNARAGVLTGEGGKALELAASTLDRKSVV